MVSSIIHRFLKVSSYKGCRKALLSFWALENPKAHKVNLIYAWSAGFPSNLASQSVQILYYGEDKNSLSIQRKIGLESLRNLENFYLNYTSYWYSIIKSNFWQKITGRKTGKEQERNRGRNRRGIMRQCDEKQCDLLWSDDVLRFSGNISFMVIDHWLLIISSHFSLFTIYY